MGKLLKNIGKGIWNGVKDVAPLPTKAMRKDLENGAAVGVNPKEIAVQIITEKLTAASGSILVIIYLVDQIFKFGLFN